MSAVRVAVNTAPFPVGVTQISASKLLRVPNGVPVESMKVNGLVNPGSFLRKESMTANTEKKCKSRTCQAECDFAAQHSTILVLGYLPAPLVPLDSLAIDQVGSV